MPASSADSSTDRLTIEADLDQSAVLLITDPYSSGWRVRGLPGTSQKKYDLMPADYILRAIPMDKGHHRIRLEYSPLAFRAGKWISVASLFIFAALIIWHYRINRLT